MEYIVVKQKRKTMALIVNDRLEVIVKVPQYITKKQIEHFVQSNSDWITKTLDRKKQLREKSDWIQTGEILYLGKYWPVQMLCLPEERHEAVFNGRYFKINADGSEACARSEMEKLFRKLALEQLTVLSKEYAKLLNVKINKITIRKQATRWGSCSSKGNLSFNVKILCAPVEMAAYVVLHEVMHLRHFNHSEAFWKDIEEVMPDYKERMNYFKQFGQNFII